MKYIVLTLIFVTTFNHAEVNTKPSKPSVKPVIKASYDSLSRDDYDYNPLYNDDEIAEKNASKVKKEKMLILEKERNASNLAKQQELQKKNKAAYDKQMKAYENRERKLEADNIIIISDEPVK
ncbi:MAG: hypothetical protein GQ531_03635 [Sulfurovum sp.]|nr:hypothetical protein [Sulfurovum sp.]